MTNDKFQLNFLFNEAQCPFRSVCPMKFPHLVLTINRVGAATLSRMKVFAFLPRRFVRQRTPPRRRRSSYLRRSFPFVAPPPPPPPKILCLPLAHSLSRRSGGPLLPRYADVVFDPAAAAAPASSVRRTAGRNHSTRINSVAQRNVYEGLCCCCQCRCRHRADATAVASSFPPLCGASESPPRRPTPSPLRQEERDESERAGPLAAESQTMTASFFCDRVRSTTTRRALRACVRAPVPSSQRGSCQAYAYDT